MESLQRFQDLLKKLFQFEASDLDFGIYRILNYKRDRIEKFINEDLKDIVETAFTKHKDEKLANIDQRFKETEEKVIQNFGSQAITPTGDLKEDFKNTPLGKEFLSIKEQREEAQAIDEIKLQVFNDLYNFFSRYYEEGDFVPQYRYSIKGHKYAIPYNGEEVKLYYANYDQYYTKTGLLFRDYTFKANNLRVIFRIVSAKEELGSKKATKERFFILDEENPVEIIEDKTLIVCFQYRELTEEEVKGYQVEGGSNTTKQEKINRKTYEDVLEKIKDIELRVPLAKDYKNEEPLLLYQLGRFTAKNTRDYFTHKNLKRFLSEQLDYFIKAEVLDIETLEKERFLDKHITRAKVVREIGGHIIDFLSQIEDFQKRLWEKKKFVLKTEYVITTDRVPEEFYGQVWNNESQRKEWMDLGFDIPETKAELRDRKLPIDTRHFSQEFKEKLLEKLTENSDLDDLLDGLLVKSENWQALNLLSEKYKEKVQTIYIDPPYNTGSDGFLYRDRYQHSSWIAMMEDRLSLARGLMRDDGVIFVSIDDNELERLKIIGSYIFGENNFLETFIWNNTSTPPSLSNISRKNVEYILTFTKREFKRKFKGRQAEGNDAPLINRGNPMRVVSFPQGSVNFKVPDGIYKRGKKGNVYLLDDVEVKNGINNNVFRLNFESKWSQETLDEEIKKGTIFIIKSENFAIRYLRKEATEEWITPDKYIDRVFLDKKVGVGTNEDSTKEIKNFGLSFSSYPKPSSLIYYLIRMIASKNDLVLDFFAGSGTTAHAIMKLNKEDGGKRKFILIEMADYFDTIIIPRIKKVAYSFNWKDSKPQDTDGIGGFFKYQTLEQYEDTLDNIELTENKHAQLKFGDDYLLEYFLDFETRESPYLLNIDYLKSPFSYKLKVNLEEVGEPQEIAVDIPETFNYLLGLKIKKIKARNNQGKYLFILGEKEGKDIAIVWREYEDDWNENDFMKDKEFIIQELKPWTPHIVYVNGQSVLTPKLGNNIVEIRYIEPEFKRLMV